MPTTSAECAKVPYDSSIVSQISTATTSIPAYSPSLTSSIVGPSDSRKDKIPTAHSAKKEGSSKNEIVATNVLPDNAAAKRSDASKYSFGSNQYTRASGSLSDAELIFGMTDSGLSSISTSSDKSSSASAKKLGRDGNNYNTSIDTSDSVFSGNDNKRDTYCSNRSMSVSSVKDVEYIYQPTNSSTNVVTSSYRVYEGIQNAAFSDFDSPSSMSSVASTTGNANTNTKNRSIYEDDYDLK